jgi:hypothetical protein
MNLLITFIIAGTFFVITMLVHIAICNLGNPNNFMLKGLVVGAFGTIGSAFYMLSISNFNIIGPYIVFSAWLFYLMILINLLNSVTLKMLAKLYNSPAGRLSAKDFDQAFNTEDGFETRLTMLHSSKLLNIQGTSLTLTPKSRLLLAIVRQVKIWLSIS